MNEEKPRDSVIKHPEKFANVAKVAPLRIYFIVAI